MKTKIFTLIFCCLFALTLSAQKSILFVGTDGTVFGSEDYALINEIQNAGLDYIVTFVSGADFKTDTYKNAASYSSYDGIFISESVGSGDIINYKNAGFPIPCVTTEGYAPNSDKWGFLTDNAQQDQINSDELEGDGDQYIIIINNTHYITSVFEENYQLAWTTAPDRTTGLGGTGFNLNATMPEAIPLGKYSLTLMDNLPTIWAIPEGTLTPSADVLPRIVFIGTIVASLGQYATDDINTIFIRSLQWAMDDIPTSVQDKAVNSFNALASPNPAVDRVNISFTLQENAQVGVTIYDIAGRLIKTLPAQQYNLGDNKIEVDLPTLSNALYIYELDINGVKVQGKFEIAQ